jgi:tetratricopeptide (TPR) repeat protein
VRYRTALAVAALVAITLLVYFPAWHYDFVRLDDPDYVTVNPQVVGGLTWAGVAWAFTTGHAGNWHPITWLSHMADAQLFDLNAGAHHVTNLVLHVANTLLLFGLLRRMTGAVGRSAVVAALFAVHPLHVESVAWVAERKDVLSTFFWMLTLWAYVAWVRRPRWTRYLAALALFGLGLMAKPMLVTLPFTLLLLDVWPLARAPRGGPMPGAATDSPHDGSAAHGGPPDTATWPRLLAEKIPFFLLAAASSAVTFVVQQRGHAVGGLDAFPLGLRVGNALISYVAYIREVLWPANLTVLYAFPGTLSVWAVAGSGLALALLTAAVVYAGRRRPYLAVGWLWYLGTLVPVIGLVQVGVQARADRYTYVPAVGLFIVVAWGMADVLPRWRARRYVLPSAAALAIVGCAVVARGQVAVWENSVTLWSHAVRIAHVENAIRGTAPSRAERLDQAQLGEALADHNLGLALADAGRLSEAIDSFSAAVRLEPDYAQAHADLGLALARANRNDEAMAQYSEALRLQPDMADVHNNLGVQLAQHRRLEEARRHFEEAVRLDPGFELAQVNLGLALARTGRREEAIVVLQQVLRTHPNNESARRALEVVLKQP